MIGYPSLLLRALMILVAAGVSLGLARSSLSRPKKLLVSLLFGFAGVAMGAQLVFNAVDLAELRGLRADEIDAIVVGDLRIEDPHAVDEVVACLAQATWFDGKRGAHRAFDLVRYDGTRRRWEVARLWRGGAVIDFGLQALPVFRPYRGAAYVACLPETLGRHGVALP